MSEMWNVFDKPDEQNEARFNSAMARKGGMKFNLWHGCHRKSEGCLHCYVFRRDAEFEKDSNVVAKTSTFNLPIRRDRQGNWKVPSGTLMWTCFTSDFFIEEADEYHRGTFGGGSVPRLFWSHRVAPA